MGTCYSKKARGGNHPYTTTDMASTKLEDTSRLARTTPYARSQNSNIDYGAKRTPPLVTKRLSLATPDQNDIKNSGTNIHSSIPRFSSSLPVSAPVATKKKSTVNDNEVIHVVNNNSIVGSRSSVTVSTPLSRISRTEKPKSTKSLPDKMQDSAEKSKTPFRVFGMSRRSMGKSSPGLSAKASPDHQGPSKPQNPRQGLSAGSKPNGASPLTKSPSRKGFESRDSISDFDSGIGNSLTDKNKPEDTDTVKSLEQIEFQEDFSPSLNVDACPSRQHSSTPKSPNILKAPLYKREQNGKWSFDEKHFGPEPNRPEPKPVPSPVESHPRERHSFKMNASENIFSTYASYKGLLSYQKKSVKPIDASKFNSREKASSPDKSPQTLTGIPKIRRQPTTPGGSVFYVNETDSTSKPSNGKYPSPDSENSGSTEGVLSPPSDRDFLIDDEIADQPGLTIFNDATSEDSDVQSLKQAVTELHALQQTSSSKKRTDSISSYTSRRSRLMEQRDSLALGSELGSSCSSIGSDDLMMDYEKTFDGYPEGTINEGPASPMRKLSDLETDKITPLKADKNSEFGDRNKKFLHRRSSGSLVSQSEREWRHRTVSLPLRPPRQMSIAEADDDGGLRLDSSSYRLLCQDLNGVKTMLFRLKSVIQEAETINPFDQSNPNNLFYHSLAQNDFPSSIATPTSSAFDEGRIPDIPTTLLENADLRRQIVLLQTLVEDKDRTIHLLQQQMSKYLNVSTPPYTPATEGLSNAATQTEASRSFASNSAEDSNGTIISIQEDFEQSFRRKSKEQDVLTEHLKEVSRLLDLKPRTHSPPHSEC